MKAEQKIKEILSRAVPKNEQKLPDITNNSKVNIENYVKVSGTGGKVTIISGKVLISLAAIIAALFFSLGTNFKLF